MQKPDEVVKPASVDAEVESATPKNIAAAASVPLAGNGLHVDVRRPTNWRLARPAAHAAASFAAWVFITLTCDAPAGVGDPMRSSTTARVGGGQELG